MRKSAIERHDAETIVDLVRRLRTVGVNNHRPTVRACVAIAKVLVYRSARPSRDDSVFRWTCEDILDMDTAKVTREGESVMGEKLEEAIDEICA